MVSELGCPARGSSRPGGRTWGNLSPTVNMGILLARGRQRWLQRLLIAPRHRIYGCHSYRLSTSARRAAAPVHAPPAPVRRRRRRRAAASGAPRSRAASRSRRCRAQLAELEGALGRAPLRARSAARSCSRPAGEALVARARRVLARRRRPRRRGASGSAIRSPATVRLGVIPTISSYLLPDLARALQRRARAPDGPLDRGQDRDARGRARGRHARRRASSRSRRTSATSRASRSRAIPSWLAAPRGHALARRATPVTAQELARRARAAARRRPLPARPGARRLRRRGQRGAGLPRDEPPDAGADGRRGRRRDAAAASSRFKTESRRAPLVIRPLAEPASSDRGPRVASARRRSRPRCAHARRDDARGLPARRGVALAARVAARDT